MTDKEKNITTVLEADKDFIRDLVALPAEKQILIKGIIIGMDLLGNPTAQEEKRKLVV